MYLDRISAAKSGTALVARDALAVQHWEAVVAAAELATEQYAWPSRPIASWPNWLVSCWDRAQSSGVADQNRLLLSTSQTDRLWQQVIDSSPAGQTLISSRGISAWARAARRSLFEYGLSERPLHGVDWQNDAAAFLEWNGRFGKKLAENGWVDPDSLLHEINRLPAAAIGQDLMLLDPATATPASERLFSAWRAAGFHVDAIAPDDHNAILEARIAADPRAELEIAARWAAMRLSANPGSRLAVVMPDLEARYSEIECVFNEHIGPDHVRSSAGPGIADIGIFGAAMTAIELLSGSGDFETLSRWLRSPFFSSDDPNRDRQAALLEIALRSDPRSQQQFGQSWQQAGLRDTFKRFLPDTAKRIDRALKRLPRRATATGWTTVWQSCLEILAWRGFETPLADFVQASWDRGWAEFSGLTAIDGAIGVQSSVDSLRRVLSTQSIYRPMPLSGIQLLSNIPQIGPGFDGAWVGGCTDESLSDLGGANPLLPWSLQAGHRMPGASPDLELEAAQNSLQRLCCRVPEIVFSCPARVVDQPLLPSVLIKDWQPAEEVAADGQTPTAGRIRTRSWESLPDRPLPLAGTVIRGGTRTLDLQAASPIKAFCVSRLGAEALEIPARGIDPRLKGMLIHRALELLLDPAQKTAAASRIGSALTQAFSELVPAGNDCWDALVQLERGRITALIDQLIETEIDRPPFETVSVERRTRIDIGEWQLRCRIDRIDRIENGGELLIDYKTGRAVGARWFDTRLSDCQLPLYAQAGNAVAGIATIRLSGKEIEYRGAALDSLALPGRVRRYQPDEWQVQLLTWRTQIGQLIEEFVSGDVRLRTDANQFVAAQSMEHAGGAFAPLSRAGDQG